MNRENDNNIRSNLVSARATAARRMDPTEAASAIVDALNRENDANVRDQLATALAESARRMAPAESARICGKAAVVFIDALNREATGSHVRDHLSASALGTLAAGMEPSNATRILTDLLLKERETSDLSHLASELSSVVRRLDTAEALRTYGQLESVLSNAMAKETNDRSSRAALLVALADRMVPAEFESNPRNGRTTIHARGSQGWNGHDG